jgi:hypothetical protein
MLGRRFARRLERRRLSCRIGRRAGVLRSGRRIGRHGGLGVRRLAAVRLRAALLAGVLPMLVALTATPVA